MTIANINLDLAALQPDTLILTPNRRLAAWLGRDYDSLQQSLGRKSWPSLNVQPLDSWLQQLYRDACLLQSAPSNTSLRLLTGLQSAFCWQQVLERCYPDKGGAELQDLAQLAQQARLLASRWHWTENDWRSARRLEETQFLEWHQQYRALLARISCMDQADLAGWVMSHCTALRSGLPGQILLHGFNDPDEPQLRAIADWLAVDERQLFFSDNLPRTSACEIRTLPQVDEQFSQAILWAVAEHKQYTKVGIVIPNLQSRRHQVQMLCRHIWSLQPESAEQHWQNIFNITASQSLTDYPQVAQRLLWLQGIVSGLNWQEWRLLLTSPYFCKDETEWLQRDEFFQWLTRFNLRRLTLSALAGYCRDFTRLESTATWLGRIEKQAQSVASKKNDISTWIHWLDEFYALLQSRAGRPLDSEEYQIQKRLQEAHTELKTLSGYSGPLNRYQFYEMLVWSLSKIQFQPQTITAPIQIMGTLEAAGLLFDRLWVCELEAVNWPQPVNPNPFLSRSRQRALDMPGASPERELIYAQRLLEGFRQAATQVIFSWGQRQNDTEHTMSGLLADITESVEIPRPYQSAAFQQYQQYGALVIAQAADTQGSRVSSQHAKGGSSIIKSQSACPFKAFGEFRLKLRQQDELEDGVRLSDRGNYLHCVMEAIWSHLKNSQALQDLLEDEQALDTFLNTIFDEVDADFRKRVILKPEILYQLERNRAVSLAKEWLVEHEARRQPFDVAGVEVKKTLSLGGLELNLVVDRIDSLPNNGLIIVDYKTGEKKQKSWMGDRPEEPQLPLYALLEKDNVRGLLFGILKAGALGFNGILENFASFGIGNEKKFQPEIGDWNQQMQEWERILLRLASDYLEGKAEVDPLKDACKYCHLGPVCRIRESARDRD